MQSLHVLRCALRGSLLPLHLEQRRAARSANRNKRVSQCEASTFPRHRTRCAPTVSAPTTLLHTATALQHTLSTAGAVVRYLPCTKCFWQSLLAPVSTASKRYTIIAFFPTLRCTRIIRLRQSRFVANGTRRLTFFASPSTADNGTAVRAVIGRVRNRILRQLPDLYASATPHSLRSTVSAPSPGH